MKPIIDFAFQVGAKIILEKDLIVKRDDRYFLLNKDLKQIVRRNFYYAGTYLGKTRAFKFFPSFELMDIIARGKSNKLVVDNKTAWLFICGRDIFRKGILSIQGSKAKGAHSLILNEHGECLGFGRILYSLERASEGAAVKNISDIGDFLRREL